MTMLSEGSESERPYYWHPAFKRALKLTRDLPCPTCGKSYVRVFSHAQTGNGGQAWCPDCSVRWRVHDGLPVDGYREPLLGAYAQYEQWLKDTYVLDPWEAIEALIDGEEELHAVADDLAGQAQQQREIQTAELAAAQARRVKQEAYKQRLRTTDPQLLSDREYRKLIVIDPLIQLYHEYRAADRTDLESEARWRVKLTTITELVCEDCLHLAQSPRRQLCRRHQADPGAPEHK